jgi:hypothetical protein
MNTYSRQEWIPSGIFVNFLLCCLLLLTTWDALHGILVDAVVV